jgi:hypothetical protein
MNVSWFATVEIKGKLYFVDLSDDHVKSVHEAWATAEKVAKEKQGRVVGIYSRCLNTTTEFLVNNHGSESKLVEIGD